MAIAQVLERIVTLARLQDFSRVREKAIYGFAGLGAPLAGLETTSGGQDAA